MLSDKTKYIEHIKDKDQILIMRKILDKIERVFYKHSLEVTDFLDPYQRRLAYSFLNKFLELSYHEEGGYSEAERKAIIIYPSYLDLYDIENYISAIRIEGKFKFNELSHRDYLGALMALGIKREKIGDIIVSEKQGIIVLHKEILDYVLFNFKEIGKEKIEATEISLKDVIKGKTEYKEISTTVASLRLDGIISSAFNISRSNSLNYINNNRVKVNYQPVDQPSYLIKERDLISVRGLGRVEFYMIKGTSKRDRVKIILRKIL